MHYGVLYSSSAIVSLISYTNYDWAGDTLDRGSTAGYLFQVGSCLISRYSKKLRTLYLSSCEAEYKETKGETKHVPMPKTYQNLTDPTELICANQSEIQVVYNSLYHSKDKHIDLDTHYIRDLFVDDIICLE